MAKMSCFSVLAGRKKKSKGDKEASDPHRYRKKLESLQLKMGEKQTSNPLDYKKEVGNLQLKMAKNPKVHVLDSTSYSLSVPFGVQKNSTCDAKVMNDSIGGAEAVEVAYEGGDEGDGDLSMKRELSGFSFQSQVANKEEEKNSMNRSMGSSNTINEMNDPLETDSEKEAEVVGDQLIESGHISDPGMGKAEFWATPILKRSCSNLETSDTLKKIADQLPPSKSHSFEDLENLAYRVRGEVAGGIRGSPMSVMTPCSADRVMLKKHSSSQVLPSRSRRIWWKLFLWSHRNLHKPLTVKARLLAIEQSSKQEGGYCSDTFEPSRPSDSPKLKLKSPVSFTEESETESKFHKWGNFDSRFSGFQPQNQWVAFSTESSSLKRVDEWVNNLEIEPPLQLNDEEIGDEGIVFPPSPEAGESSARAMIHMNQRNNANVSEEVLHANSVIQSLNSSSTVAHISAMSLKVIPAISHFSSLRSVNLSGNFIVRITPGSLPKGLHTLNLSRNKIVAIEGLRELTRLRVLDLSYNRISRIGHGLSNCTLIKELYLAGNKISDLEGLHRLLKLTVLDLSFNKVTTAKALGQLVANYNSLLALNLLGNPIQSNIGDDQLRKVISGILPQLAYLNKQPIKPQRTREVAMDSVARAALGNNEWTSRRKQSKRVSQVGSSSLGKNRSRIGGGQKNKHRSKNSTQHSYSPLIRSSTAVAASSH